MKEYKEYLNDITADAGLYDKIMNNAALKHAGSKAKIRRIQVRKVFVGALLATVLLSLTIITTYAVVRQIDPVPPVKTPERYYRVINGYTYYVPEHNRFYMEIYNGTESNPEYKDFVFLNNIDEDGFIHKPPISYEHDDCIHKSGFFKDVEPKDSGNYCIYYSDCHYCAHLPGKVEWTDWAHYAMCINDCEFQFYWYEHEKVITPINETLQRVQCSFPGCGVDFIEDLESSK